MSAKIRGKAQDATRAAKLLAGFQKHLAAFASLTFASKTYTPSQITAALQLIIALRAAIEAAKAVLKAKLWDEKAERPALLAIMTGLESFVKVTYSESPDILADFGLEPKKVPTPLTTEQQVVAVAKRISTRAARGTTGPKAKLKIKGNVVGVVLTKVKASPVVAPPADEADDSKPKRQA
jgi:hypothetical protein